ncbi:MAG: alpha/beta hydrolase-fold protein [Xanthomonadales bacterium]|nr:alpha/beta hydrolase-fold protein [Xanthomonadales bacterium]
MFSRLLAVLFAVACATAFAQPAPVSVEFTVHAPDLPRGAKVYLSGGTPSLGNWSPDAVPMTYLGRDTWRVVILFKRPMTVEYRYTLGTEERRGADDRGQPLDNFRVATRRNLEIRDEVTRWTDANTVVESRGQVTGELRYHRHVRDGTVPPRDLVVWLPRFYELRDRMSYPVLYLNDGQDLFDPLTAEGGRDWGVDEAMTRLIADEEIEPMIVVGITGSEDRLAEYAPGESGEDYMRFIVETVKPLIDRRYRTRPGRESTYVGGAAMGGVIAFATAWSYPEVFSAALSLSPAFRLEGRLDTLPWFEARAGDEVRPVFFYLDSGGQGADALLRPGVEDMADLLQEWGYRPERNFVFVRDFDADHGAAAWGRRFPNALTRSLRGAERLETFADRRRDPGLEPPRAMASPWPAPQ